MPKKLDKEGKPSVHDELEGFDIKINEFGVMETSYNVDKLNGLKIHVSLVRFLEVPLIRGNINLFPLFCFIIIITNYIFKVLGVTLFSFTTDFEYEVDREKTQDIGFQKD